MALERFISIIFEKCVKSTILLWYGHTSKRAKERKKNTIAASNKKSERKELRNIRHEAILFDFKWKGLQAQQRRAISAKKKESNADTTTKRQAKDLQMRYLLKIPIRMQEKKLMKRS